MIERMPASKSTPQTSDMALEGGEAVALYVAKIGRNLVELHRQVGLLRAAYLETKQSLREIGEQPALHERTRLMMASEGLLEACSVFQDGGADLA